MRARHYSLKNAHSSGTDDSSPGSRQLGSYPWSISGGTLDRCREILFARNIKGAHFAVGFDRSHHHLPKGAPL